jgi:hypothetical protein
MARRGGFLRQKAGFLALLCLPIGYRGDFVSHSFLDSYVDGGGGKWASRRGGGVGGSGFGVGNGGKPALRPQSSHKPLCAEGSLFCANGLEVEGPRRASGVDARHLHGASWRGKWRTIPPKGADSGLKTVVFRQKAAWIGGVFGVKTANVYMREWKRAYRRQGIGSRE